MVEFLGDPTGAFTRAVGMTITHAGPSGVLGPGRCKRFVLVVANGAVTAVSVSEAPDDPAGDNAPDGPVTALTRVEHVLTLL
jgi:peroxiredoxin